MHHNATGCSLLLDFHFATWTFTAEDQQLCWLPPFNIAVSDLLLITTAQQCYDSSSKCTDIIFFVWRCLKMAFSCGWSLLYCRRCRHDSEQDGRRDPFVSEATCWGKSWSVTTPESTEMFWLLTSTQTLFMWSSSDTKLIFLCSGGIWWSVERLQERHCKVSTQQKCNTGTATKSHIYKLYCFNPVAASNLIFYNSP